jgi:menaquinol-cytochrome c reductase iron-sulfur subunit
LVEPHAHGPEEHGHAPSPSLWPVGFAVGVAVLLTGLVIDWLIVAIGGAIALLFGFLWLRDMTGPGTVPGVHAAPETGIGAEAAPPTGAPSGQVALPLATEYEVERFPRRKFLEASTLGLGGVITGLVTLPAVGFAVVPAFVGQEHEEVDIGPLDAFPEGQWRVVTFMENPDEGEVTRRTSFVRYNGLLDGQPSFTILSNRCVHLGCPVQPSGTLDEENAEEERANGRIVVQRIPANPAAFACPCHGGAYDTEGDRTAGPPVRSLDRYDYAVKSGRLVLLGTYSVGKVEGEGKDAVVTRYDLSNPGIHVDGPEQVLYPVNAPG